MSVRSPRRPIYTVLGWPARCKRSGFSGIIDAVFLDYQAALDCHIVPHGWFEVQRTPPTTRDQVFYSLTGPEGSPGAVLAAEEDMEVES